MDDKFLYQLKEPPDTEFVNNLYRKLRQDHPEPNRSLNLNFDNLNSKKPVLVAVFLVISLFVLVVISPARAFVSSFFANVAGQLFEVTEDYPGDNYPGGEEIIEPQVMSLEDSLAIFPYSIQLPAHIPSEYILNEDNVRVYVGEDAGPFANTIEFEWISNNHLTLILKIADYDWSIRELVGPDSIEEIFLVEDHSAVLIRGGWDADNKIWNNDVGVRLRWSVDNLLYELMGADQKQLIEIATSTIK